ncbi:MAG: hypothetical protein CMH32_08010 [Micavibrio sp.]|nr:hypothetical protein [Micavibrio sp.]|tara:strand:- start:845 stop:1621 length:777 start_codon:yes stop_codon:yes gene_type:complete
METIIVLLQALSLVSWLPVDIKHGEPLDYGLYTLECPASFDKKVERYIQASSTEEESAPLPYEAWPFFSDDEKLCWMQSYIDRDLDVDIAFLGSDIKQSDGNYEAEYVSIVSQLFWKNPEPSYAIVIGDYLSKQDKADYKKISLAYYRYRYLYFFSAYRKDSKCIEYIDKYSDSNISYKELRHEQKDWAIELCSKTSSEIYELAQKYCAVRNEDKIYFKMCDALMDITGFSFNEKDEKEFYFLVLDWKEKLRKEAASR